MSAFRAFNAIKGNRYAKRKIASITIWTSATDWTLFGPDYTFDEYTFAADEGEGKTTLIPMEKISKVVVTWQ